MKLSLDQLLGDCILDLLIVYDISYTDAFKIELTSEMIGLYNQAIEIYKDSPKITSVSFPLSKLIKLSKLVGDENIIRDTLVELKNKKGMKVNDLNNNSKAEFFDRREIESGMVDSISITFKNDRTEIKLVCWDDSEYVIVAQSKENEAESLINLIDSSYKMARLENF